MQNTYLQYLTQITEDGDLAVLSGSNQFSVSDKVIRGGVKIQKRDLETGDTKPQGSATLKDTAFDIISLNDNAVLVEGKLYKKNEVVKTIRTDIEGVASTSADLLPYGKFRIVESEAPDGYLTDGAKPIDFTITENGKIVDLTEKAHSIYNQIKRGDIEGVKIGAGTHKRLADVPFRITSKTTGENHVVVTDDNGQFSTSADWASHKHNTNAGKTSEDGVWFGTSEPDDSKGALPYDTYIIEEIRSDSNKGFELIPPFEIVVSRNNLVIDLGTLTDEYEKEISIHTTATSKDGEKTILAGKEVTIVDTIKLDGLTKGTKYQLKGWQMLKEENAELIIDGKRVENDYTFVADDEEMKVEISYTFNASALGGKNLVTFEELYDFSNPDEPVKVAEHKDIEDDGQTVLITERIIKIHTTATDKDDNKELEAGKDVVSLVIVNLLGIPEVIFISINFVSIGLLAIYFLAIYVLVLLNLLRRIRKMTVHDFLYFDKQNEKKMFRSNKKRNIIFIVSVILGITAILLWASRWTMENSGKQETLTYLMISMMMLIISIYGVSATCADMLLSVLLKNKKLKYQKDNLFVTRTFIS